jgi:hypothetical protein
MGNVVERLRIREVTLVTRNVTKKVLVGFLNGGRFVAGQPGGCPAFNVNRSSYFAFSRPKTPTPLVVPT